jgi:hypothetical protein
MTTGSNRLTTILITAGLVLAVLMFKSLLGPNPLPATSLSAPAESALSDERSERRSNQPTILKPESLQEQGRVMASPRQDVSALGFRHDVSDLPTAPATPTVPQDYLSAPSLDLLPNP